MNEETRYFQEIFEQHHDPEVQLLKRLLKRKQEKIEDKRQDLGLDVSKTG